MKFELKSNYNDFIKRIRKIPYLIDEGLRASVEKILKKMCEDMKFEINANRGVWFDGGALDVWESHANIDEDIHYVLSDDGMKGTIIVGDTADRIVLGNGDTVNPYLFIEFGYGIIGEQHPARYARENLWEYNVNDHVNFIIYAYDDFSGNKSTVFTQGTKGINFFYNTVAKYRKEWARLAKEDTLKYYSEKG